MSTPHVIIIAGPNGAGKSTVAPYLLRDTLGITEFVNADQIAAGLSAFNPEAAAFEAGRVMLKRLKELASQRVNFSFETTLASRSFVPFIKKLQADGYQFHLLYIWLQSAKLAAERVDLRVQKGGHAIPPDVIARRYQRSIDNFFNLYQPVADTWRVYDNSTGRPHLIAQGDKSGADILTGDPQWQKLEK